MRVIMNSWFWCLTFNKNQLKHNFIYYFRVVRINHSPLLRQTFWLCLLRLNSILTLVLNKRLNLHKQSYIPHNPHT